MFMLMGVPALAGMLMFVFMLDFRLIFVDMSVLFFQPVGFLSEQLKGKDKQHTRRYIF